MYLPNIERIIVHGNCPDGMASAILLYDALKIEPEFMLHGTNEYVDLEATEGMLFCDIAPPEDRYKEFVKAGAIVLDHHRGSKYIVEACGENGRFADEKDDPGKSGAWLAYEYVWKHKADYMIESGNKQCSYWQAEDFVTLAGIRDTWQIENTLFEDACYQASALMFYSWDHWKAAIDCGEFCYMISDEIGVGQMIFNSRLVKARKCAKEAYIYEDAGHKIAIFNDPDHLTSDVAGILDDAGVNVIAGFHYSKKHPDDENPLVCFSLRSDGSIDVADLAKTLGGGGHTKSAGFSEVIDLREINAFAVFRDIFEDYINYHQ